MISRTTRKYRRALENLPTDIQHQAKDGYRLFCENPHHPSLSFKKVHTRRPIFSVRISLKYRAVGVLENDEIIWFWIGEHDQYELLLKQL